MNNLVDFLVERAQKEHSVMVWGSLFSAMAVVALLCAEIKCIEEPELTKRFGDAYKEYKKETPFIVPGIRLK